MRRRAAILAAVAIVVVLAVWASQRSDGGKPPVVLQRAAKAKPADQPVAVLIEFGLKDAKPSDWSGKAIVSGAKVVRRAGYRFRTDGDNNDRLVGNDAWKVSSHLSVRAPKRNPIIRRLEPIATVGVIYYLSDLQKDASLTVEIPSIEKPAAEVKLAEVIAGKAVSIFEGHAVVRRISTGVPVVTGGTEDDHPAAAYGPDGTLWMAYISYRLRDPSRRIEQEAYKKPPKDFKHLYHPQYAEQLWVRAYHNGRWGQPIAVTDPHQDIARCAVAVGSDNRVWIVYSAHRGKSFDIYARALTAGKGGQATLAAESQLTARPLPDVNPVACADSDGRVWAAWQSWGADGRASIQTAVCDKGKWNVAPPLKHDGNAWHPTLAASGDGDVALANDVYRNGSYDVEVTILSGTQSGTRRLIAASEAFEARPSLTFDAQNRLWIAYEYGPPKWGLDYGALDSKDGFPLFNTRSVRVRVLAGKKLMQPVAALPKLDLSAPQLPFSAPKTNGYEKRERQAYPKIAIGGDGGIWLVYRKNFGSRYTSHPGATWKNFARRLEQDRWGPEIEIHHSDGLLDSRPIVLPEAGGGILVCHNTDGRYTTPNVINNEIYASTIRVPSTKGTPKLVACSEQPSAAPDWWKSEQQAVQRIKDYRIDHNGRKLHLLRGEYHRHTEISWDGAADGSLEDMFRYAIDAAAFDWIGNGDHDNGAGREYPWWLTQKFDDAYYVPGRFTPMFTYERSVSYPHGHRNVMFAQRGVMTLPRLAAEPGQQRVAGIHPDDTKMLYRYLREFGGICAVHTSATGMGTDWRDNDPVAEPIVEIYQGDRMSYEHQGAPRAGYDPKSGKFPANVGGWRPLGFVDLALRDKGYKLAFQASSDHWSTHISYFVVLAEKNDRQAILDAVKKRHTYGATDNIILDVRSGSHIQGDEFVTKQAPSLQFYVHGTDQLVRIDVMKNSKRVHTIWPNSAEYRGSWSDPEPNVGNNYYYIRVLQRNGEIAWGSPMWIRWQP